MNQTPEELARKIREARDRQHPEGSEKSETSAKAAAGARLALRAGTDMVAAIMVGGFLGYLIDRGLGSKPWGMIIFLFVGFAAGFLNIYRSQTGQDYKVGFKNTDQKKD